MAREDAGRALAARLESAACRRACCGAPPRWTRRRARSVDTVMAAIVGAAGLASCLAAARAGKKLLLANKEALVVGGELFLAAVQQGGARLLPIDSEHSAIFQSLPEDPPPGTRGSRRSSSPPRAARSAPRAGQPARRDAGAGLRPPELGDGPQDLGRLGDHDEQGARGDRGALPVRPGAERLQVVIHPQSVIHSMVQYRDTSVVAQLGTPDMRVPIAYGLAWPERVAPARRRSTSARWPT
jgi:1-deoxy-D-xylulose-5-phosphate reductoisomerase